MIKTLLLNYRWADIEAARPGVRECSQTRPLRSLSLSFSLFTMRLINCSSHLLSRLSLFLFIHSYLLLLFILPIALFFPIHYSVDLSYSPVYSYLFMFLFIIHWYLFLCPLFSSSSFIHYIVSLSFIILIFIRYFLFIAFLLTFLSSNSYIIL